MQDAFKLFIRACIGSMTRIPRFPAAVSVVVGRLPSIVISSPSFTITVPVAHLKHLPKFLQFVFCFSKFVRSIPRISTPVAAMHSVSFVLVIVSSRCWISWKRKIALVVPPRRRIMLASWIYPVRMGLGVACRGVVMIVQVTMPFMTHGSRK